MPVSRAEFYQTLQEMLKTSADPLLQDTLPLSSPSNLSARVLRHGLAVTAFAMLEQYIIGIFDDLVGRAATGGVVFANLTDSMKQFILVDSVSGLATRLGFIKNQSDRIAFADTHVAALAGYNAVPPTYTAHGFKAKGANVGHEDVKQAFGAFGLDNAWGRMDAIAAQFGGAALSLNNEFKTLASARHRSAHDPVSAIPVSDLQSNIHSAIVIGICCDVLGKNVGTALASCVDATKLVSSVQTYSRPVRYLDEQTDGSWLERRSPTNRAVKKYPNKVDGITGATARGGTPFVVIRNSSHLPIELAG